MAWWVWLMLGLGLTAVELLSAGGFYLIFSASRPCSSGPCSSRASFRADWVQWLLFTALVDRPAPRCSAIPWCAC